jgi:alkylation response protein AidB-like acyl-CoA dehydrogenase
MTFELSAEHLAARDAARAYAQTLQVKAADIDRSGAIPAETAREIVALAAGDALVLVIVVEELAAVSAAAATLPSAASSGSALALSGLRGARELEPTSKSQLVLAAVALGIGQAATAAALAELRRSSEKRGAEVEKPHWVIADVATELEAARLMTYKAARTSNEATVALARLMASAAASRAVDAAIRIVGSAALTDGSAIERLARDVRTVSVLAGTEENQRAAAADSLLPR